MRYNVHSPCAFRNRIAKSIGVLVGAALIATLGLPSAAQAQTPAAPTVTEAKASQEPDELAAGCTVTASGWAGGAYSPGQTGYRGRIYRAWRTMGRRDGGVRNALTCLVFNKSCYHGE